MKELTLFREICVCLILISFGCVSEEEKRAAIQQIQDEQLAQMELERKRVEERLRIVDGIRQALNFDARAYKIKDSIVVTVIFKNPTAHEILDFDTVSSHSDPAALPRCMSLSYVTNTVSTTCRAFRT